MCSCCLYRIFVSFDHSVSMPTLWWLLQAHRRHKPENMNLVYLLVNDAIHRDTSMYDFLQCPYSIFTFLPELPPSLLNLQRHRPGITKNPRKTAARSAPSGEPLTRAARWDSGFDSQK